MTSLGALLADHRPANPGESAHLEAIRRLVEAPGDPTDRTRFDPGHLTASAFVLHPHREAVVLIHHAKLGIWVQPGGHLEADDADAEAAARREVDEETGLSGLTPLGLVDVDVHPIPARGSEPSHRHYDLRFGFRATEDPLRSGPGVVDVRWVPLSRVLALEESLARPARKLAGLAPG